MLTRASVPNVEFIKDKETLIKYIQLFITNNFEVISKVDAPDNKKLLQIEVFP